MPRFLLACLGATCSLALVSCEDSSSTTDGGLSDATTADGVATACDSAAQCDDGNLCNGEEICGADGRCTQPESVEDGTHCDADDDASTLDVCISGACQLSACGDGYVDSRIEEMCEDGNDDDDDGCTECSITCSKDDDCTDDNVCNGVETCNLTTNMCEPGVNVRDGTDCDADGNAGTVDVCLSGVCGLSICKDGYVDSRIAEQCEDGNDVDGDGCDSCQFSCTEDDECRDSNVCNGSETCNTKTHQCEEGTNLEDGADCDADANAATIDVCIAGACGLSICKDGYVDARIGEECEDGNDEDGDGCDSCMFSCSTDVDCGYDSNVCNGVESCDVENHVCLTPAPPPTCDSDECTIRTCNPAGGCDESAVDVDGDGFGPEDVVLASTGAACGSDCNDNNEDVKPGAGYQTTAIAGEPAETDFDYNCDGNEEVRYQQIGNCAGCNVTQGWQSAAPACGDSGNWFSWCEQLSDSNGRPAGCRSHYITRTQACR